MQTTNNRLVYALIGVIVLLIIIVGGLTGILIAQNANKTTPTTNDNTNQTPSPTPQTPMSYPTNPTPTPVSSPVTSSTKYTYENSYVKFTYTDGWSVTAIKPYQLNVTKGNYVLYFNTQAQQASGAQGGRFSEISQGATGADLVMKIQPSDPCGTSVSTNVGGFEAQKRMDLYVNSSANSEICNKPTNGSIVWYFSYITTSAGGYFNYYVPNQAKAYVITMTYKASSVNSLPVKGSADLNQKLAEMTDIVKSLEIKIK